MSKKIDLRADRVMKALLRVGDISVQDLADEVGTSAPSIRRDLARLERRGLINLTNTRIFSVPASWWGQYSSCGACNTVRTTGLTGGNYSNSVGLFGLVDGSNPEGQVELSAKINF
ncbi:MAG TPA: Lrp/AsnC family transcriptional regulator [Acidobacteriaceae bacterium]|nr:Lrp/AsnC family transcriptional regulator [Acidobacteriaceae bacterium]